jgi:hypothetical protein
MLSFRYCQPGTQIGLAPSTDPLILQIKTILMANYISLPATAFNLFASEADMETYIRSPAYSGLPNICFAITVQSSSGNNYEYKLRFNISTEVG